MGKRSDISPRKKGQIRVLLEETSLTQKEIAKKLKVSPQLVNIISKKLHNRQSISPKRKGSCGRKRLSTARDDRKLIGLCLKNRKATTRQLAIDWANSGVAASRRTVCRRLFTAGLKSRRPRKKSLLTPAMVKKRLNWAKAHSTWTAEDWSKVRNLYLIFFKVLFNNEYSIILVNDKQTVFVLNEFLYHTVHTVRPLSKFSR
jgi:transposase